MRCQQWNGVGGHRVTRVIRGDDSRQAFLNLNWMSRLLNTSSLVIRVCGNVKLRPEVLMDKQRQIRDPFDWFLD
jgi:hypothetical protein